VASKLVVEKEKQFESSWETAFVIQWGDLTLEALTLNFCPPKEGGSRISLAPLIPR